MSVALTKKIREHQEEGHGDDRYRGFDPDQLDYTVKASLTPGGEVRFFKNPQATGDGPKDKFHFVPEDAEILAVGTAFWDWHAGVCSQAGLDIDTDHEHSGGLEADEFSKALEAVHQVPWLEIRTSTGGKGLHLFCKFDRPVAIATRKEGTALGRAVVSLVSRQTGIDFTGLVDCCGGNLWIYRKDSAANAFEVLKEASENLDPDELPPGWREAGAATARKTLFAAPDVELEPAHQQVARDLAQLGGSVIWVHDQGCYHVHTRVLQQAHEEHGYMGFFATVSDGTDLGKPNGYMYPLPGGGFLVKRFGEAAEHSSWIESGRGQYAYLNMRYPISKALDHFSSAQSTSGYAFCNEELMVFLQSIDEADACEELPKGRQVLVKHKQRELQLRADRRDDDGPLEGWVGDGKKWLKTIPIEERTEGEEYAERLRSSELVRAVSTPIESTGWCVKNDGKFISTSAPEVSRVLQSVTRNPNALMGRLRLEPYVLDWQPFQPEYLPGRRWNCGAPQLACQPADTSGPTPTWDAVFAHVGSGLDQAIQECPECQRVGIRSGDHYLRLWVKLLLTKPEQRLPYLFLTSRQGNAGKSTFGNSITHLIEPGVGEITAEALTGTFTSELEGKVLCLIEELDLRDKNKKALQQLKRLLTSPTLSVRRMRTDAYPIKNFTHFIHTANDARFVPCDSEDTRVVMIQVPEIEDLIETDVFERGLKEEAPYVLKEVLEMPLPDRSGRLYLPVVHTALKEEVVSGVYQDDDQEIAAGVQAFVDQRVSISSGATAPKRKVLDAYAEFCGPSKAGGEPRYPRVHDRGFLKLMNRICGTITSKQKRVGEKRVDHYVGIRLK